MIYKHRPTLRYAQQMQIVRMIIYAACYIDTALCIVGADK